MVLPEASWASHVDALSATLRREARVARFAIEIATDHRLAIASIDLFDLVVLQIGDHWAASVEEDAL